MKGRESHVYVENKKRQKKPFEGAIESEFGRQTTAFSFQNK